MPFASAARHAARGDAQPAIAAGRPSVTGERGQFVLPLDWTAGGGEGLLPPLIVGPSNAAAVRYLGHIADWPVPVAMLTGPRRSGRSLMGRRFVATTGGTVIDDAEQAGEEAVFHAWNGALAGGTPLLLIGNSEPQSWPVRLPDLASRLAAVPVLRIAEPDDALARDLIDLLFVQRGVSVPVELAAYMVPRMERSYAAIHRAVDALDRAALSQGRRIGVRLAREILLGEGLIAPDLADPPAADGPERSMG